MPPCINLFFGTLNNTPKEADAIKLVINCWMTILIPHSNLILKLFLKKELQINTDAKNSYIYVKIGL